MLPQTKQSGSISPKERLRPFHKSEPDCHHDSLKIKLNEMYEHFFLYGSKATEKKLFDKLKLSRDTKISPFLLTEKAYLKNIQSYHLSGPCQTFYNECHPNPLPIARRSNGDCQSGSSPGFSSSLLCAFPGSLPVTYYADSLAVTVAGPRRHLPASLLSLSTPDSIHIQLENFTK